MSNKIFITKVRSFFFLNKPCMLMRLLVDILFASIKGLPVCTLRVLPEDVLKKISNIILCNI